MAACTAIGVQDRVLAIHRDRLGVLFVGARKVLFDEQSVTLLFELCRGRWRHDDDGEGMRGV